MNYLSVCSGIEAATQAWEPLGWQPVGFSEVAKFPSALLKERFPDVQNLGDMTHYERWPHTLRFDLLVGGTPCFPEDVLVLTLSSLIRGTRIESNVLFALLL